MYIFIDLIKKILPRLQKKSFDFDDESKIGDVRNVNIIKIKVQLF